MLTGKQKRYLRGEARSFKGYFFKSERDGVSANQIKGILEALEAQELIKVKILDNCPEDVHHVALDLSMHTKAEVVPNHWPLQLFCINKVMKEFIVYHEKNRSIRWEF